MNVTPDAIILLHLGPLALSATLVFTWLVMALMVAVAWTICRRLSTSVELHRGQNLLEVLVEGTLRQIHQVSRQDPRPYLPFVGTLFLFIAVSNLLDVVPGYRAPTGSLSTAAALALLVFLAVPVYGIRRRGLRAYFVQYVRPSVLMLPFNVLGELSRTLALAVRLFGNVMSGGMIAATLLAVAPLFFPVVMQLLGLLTGLIQAYIFAVLAMVYIAAATGAAERSEQQPLEEVLSDE